VPPSRHFHNASLRAAAAAGATAALLLGACGGGGSGGSASVEESLGVTSAGLLQRQGQVEAEIRDCMRAQGFEYVPVDPAARRTALVGGANLSEADFEKQYGYGITTLYEQRQAQAAGGPNVVIRAALPPAQRTAYDRALFGANVGVTFDVAFEQDLQGQLGGCTKEATEKVFGGPEVLQTITAKLAEFDQRIVADPRMVKAIVAWSGCMRTGGFDLANPEQVDATLTRKLERIVGPPDRAAALSPGAAPSYDKAALTTLQREEVAMVAADIACERRHISPVEDKVRGEYERAFREQNAPLLTRVPRP